MSEIIAESQSGADRQPGLRSLVMAYETPSLLKSSYQIATSIGLFIAGCASMYWSLHVSYLLTAALLIPTAGLLVRVFIIQHDCGHGSFFHSRRLKDLRSTLTWRDAFRTIRLMLWDEASVRMVRFADVRGEPAYRDSGRI